MGLIEINLDGKPISKLIGTIRAAIGTWYKPTAIRKEADAKAYEIEKMAEAKAKEIKILGGAELELYQKVQERITFEEVNKQKNIEEISYKAIKYLDENVSEEPVDPDWRTRFFKKSADVTNEDLQEIWAKILAQEVSKPGQVGLRTLEVLSNINKNEAQLFQTLCNMTFNDSNVLKIDNSVAFDKYGISYSAILMLRSANLVYENDSLVTKFSMAPPRDFTVLSFCGIPIQIQLPGQSNFQLKMIKLTQEGSELCRLINKNPNKVYLTDFIEARKKEGYSITELTLKK